MLLCPSSEILILNRRAEAWFNYNIFVVWITCKRILSFIKASTTGHNYNLINKYHKMGISCLIFKRAEGLDDAGFKNH